jgi:anti-sigma factor ChrR (cupin superfamily)
MSRLASRPAGFDEATMYGAVAQELVVAGLVPARQAALGARLRERIRHSTEAHRGLVTVRREEGRWLAASPGAQRRVLRKGDGVRIELLQLEPGALLPWPDDAAARELLVLRGGMAIEGEGSAAIRLPQHGHRVVMRGTSERCRAAPAGSLVYLRHRLVGSKALPASELRWWEAAQAAAPAGPRESWQVFCEDVEAIALRVESDVASMLVRVAPGARLPDHGHALDEDCMVLEGELFLGDILMRDGDYHKAGAGARHVGGFSDRGALFYFHGALPAPDNRHDLHRSTGRPDHGPSR